MGIKINGRKVKGLISGSFKTAICLGVVTALGAGLKGCIDEDTRNSEVSSAIANANNKVEALQAVTVSEKDIVTIDQGPINNIYNFATKMVIVQHNSGISAFRFGDVEPGLVSDALAKGCAKAGTLRAELKDATANGAKSELVVELQGLKDRNEAFFKAHCAGASPSNTKG